jgi:two-component system CheB/CheR fusion protein
MNEQSLLQQAFDNVPDAALVVGPDGMLTYFNRQARELFFLGDDDIGRPFRELDASLRPTDLRPLLDRVSRESEPVVAHDVEWQRGQDSTTYVDVSLRALGVDGASSGAVIFFKDVTTTHRLHQDLSYVNKQLETSYEELQSTVEELETTNEELQSTVEELETTNEELQSTNEELETTNEELQSTNDELQSANEELSERSAEVVASNAFMDTILSSLDVAVVVLDLSLAVTSWSERASDLWGLREDEATGRRLADLDIGLPADDLMPTLHQVVSVGTAERRTLAGVNRRGRKVNLIVRCNPLTDRDGQINGAIVFMEDFVVEG